MERRLAAILAADLVGYSRMMGADEEGTLARLDALHQTLVAPAMSGHRGRVVKTTGDGFLAEFASAVDAVNCAISLQQSLAEREGADRLELRIGINVGDVMFGRDDMFGDGVNIAARLEGIASPGGICISRSVWDQLGGKKVPGFRVDGAHELKNIAQPVEVWRWPMDGQGAAAPPPRENPSIAVLPFDNMSGDPEQGYFADGIAEDLITLLSKLAQLTVIARNSSFSYKGRSVKVQEVARDLGVRYLVEGSVRKAGNRVRVTAQLIDCRDGGHLWAERYDRDLTDIFEVQDEVTREIVKALSVKLTPDEARRLKPQGTDNVEAYELFLRGRGCIYGHRREDNTQARELFDAARRADPAYAPPAAYFGLATLVEYMNGWYEGSGDPREVARRAIADAVRLDPNLPYAHIALGQYNLLMRKHDQAFAAYRAAIALDPNFADAYMAYGWALHFAGRPEEGVRQIERGFLLDPAHVPLRSHWIAQALFQAHRFEEAAEHLRRRLVRQPYSDASRALLASAYGHLGRAEEAQAEWAEMLRHTPDFSVERRRKVLPYKDPADFELFPEGLRKAGIVF